MNLFLISNHPHPIFSSYCISIYKHVQYTVEALDHWPQNSKHKSGPFSKQHYKKMGFYRHFLLNALGNAYSP